MYNALLADIFAFDWEPFTDEEMDAIDKNIPMTQEIFNRCMEKCMNLPTDMEDIFNDLTSDYPDFLEVYANNLWKEFEILESNNDVKVSPEEIQAGWETLCQRIRSKYGPDAI